MTVLERADCSVLRTDVPFFDSLRRDYAGFDAWMARAAADRRAAMTMTLDGQLAALAIVKDEDTHPAGELGPGLKVCTFKVAEPFRRQGLGARLLADVITYAHHRGARWVYVTTFDQHQDLVRMLTCRGFTTAAARNAAGELTLTRTLRTAPRSGEGRAVLMSIHPRYAAGILDGTKRVELRKRPLAPDVTTVVVYATKPVGRVVGWFELAGQDTGTPEEIWDRHRGHAGIERAAYDAYFAGARTSVALGVAGVHALRQPVTVTTLAGVCGAPQSWQYLSPENLRLLGSLPVT